MKIQNQQGDHITETKDHITINKDNESKAYDVLEKKGELQQSGYCILNNIYVNAGREAEFEDRFLSRQSNLSSSEGFIALRVLKPLDDLYYVILSLWESRDAFENWQDSSQYKNTHKKRGTSKGLDSQIVNRELSHNVGFEIVRITAEL